MEQESTPITTAVAEDARPGKATRVGGSIVAGLILVSLILYFVGDRVTPYTSQARIQAFVIPIAAEVSGKVQKVHIKNNDEVQPGQLLFEIDPDMYAIALAGSRAAYESARLAVSASGANFEAARASYQAAIANRDMAEKDAGRLEKLYQEDPGAISVRRLEIAQSTRDEARSKAKRAEADMRQAQETAGEQNEGNAALLSAKGAVEKAEIDLSNTKVISPARGRVTDLRVDAGHFAQAGAPLLTLIAEHDLWVSADMTENNLGNIDVGDEAAIVLDVLPGTVLKGRVRSVGGGVSSGQSGTPGTLPTVDNNRDWLRQAQRIPVVIEFDAKEVSRLKGARVGGQADVLVYAGNSSIMNFFAAIYIHVMSWLSYFY
ncbi:MAG: HlyD family secretion protein [Povalibacter sp.]